MDPYIIQQGGGYLPNGYDLSGSTPPMMATGMGVPGSSLRQQDGEARLQALQESVPLTGTQQQLFNLDSQGQVRPLGQHNTNFQNRPQLQTASTDQVIALRISENNRAAEEAKLRAAELTQSKKHAGQKRRATDSSSVQQVELYPAAQSFIGRLAKLHAHRIEAPYCAIFDPAVVAEQIFEAVTEDDGEDGAIIPATSMESPRWKRYYNKGFVSVPGKPKTSKSTLASGGEYTFRKAFDNQQHKDDSAMGINFILQDDAVKQYHTTPKGWKALGAERQEEYKTKLKEHADARPDGWHKKLPLLLDIVDPEFKDVEITKDMPTAEELSNLPENEREQDMATATIEQIARFQVQYHNRFYKPGASNAGVSYKEDAVLMVLKMREEATRHEVDGNVYYILPGLPRLQVIDHGFTHYVTDELRAKHQRQQVAAAQAAQAAAQAAAAAAANRINVLQSGQES